MEKSEAAFDDGCASELFLRNANFLAPPSHIEYIVESVLKARETKRLAKRSEQRLRDAIEASGIRPAKFENRPHLAPASKLLDPICQRLVRHDQLTGAVLRIWAENEKDLRSSVANYAKAHDLPVEAPDYKKRRFRGLMALKNWNSAISGITSDKKKYHHPHDVAIMFCLVTGRLPRLIEQSIGGNPVTGPSLPSGNLLEGLKASLAGPDGLNVAEKFVEAASKIVEEARLEEDQLQELKAESTRLRYRFTPELVFLGSELPAALSDPRRVLAGHAERLYRASTAIEKLGVALEEFRSASSVEYASRDQWEKGIEREKSSGSEVRSLITQLHTLLPETPAPPKQEVEPEPLADDTFVEMDVLRAEILRLDRENGALRKKSFNDDGYIALLRNGSRNNSGQTQTAPAEDVREAVELARERFVPHQLLICLNGASDPYTKFQRPEEVLQALTWLATKYREGRVNGGMDDPEHSLKTACSGWKYASDNSEMAMNQYPDAYSTTTPDGMSYALAHHLKKGVDNDERHTIRIAFAWDDQQELVVVGYLGKHQPSNY